MFFRPIPSPAPAITSDEARLLDRYLSWVLKDQAAKAAPDNEIERLSADFAWIMLELHATFAGWVAERDGPYGPWVKATCRRLSGAQAQALRRAA